MRIWVQLYCFIKCGDNKSIAIGSSDFECYNASIIKVKDCTQVQFFDGRSDIIFEFSYISKPLLIWFISMKIPFQYILCSNHRCWRNIRLFLYTSNWFQMQYLHKTINAFFIVIHIMLTVDHNCHLTIA